jgi:repressor LexA
MRKITEKQKKIIGVIREFIHLHGYPPSYRELGEILKLASPSTVKGHLVSLREKGYVNWEEGRPRTLHIIEEQTTFKSYD